MMHGLTNGVMSLTISLIIIGMTFVFWKIGEIVVWIFTHVTISW
jgi:hypothetical protein